jgi:SAM-dependent methyltransferase
VNFANADEVAGLVDRLLGACGGGRTLHIGPAAPAMASAFRRRGVEAMMSPAGDTTFDLVCAYGVLDAVSDEERHAAIERLLRLSRRALLITAGGDARDQWDAAVLTHACRRHPLRADVVPYNGLDWETAPWLLLYERLPDAAVVGRSLADLAPARDLHMDMLREAGRRADAHIARYMLARQFVREGDRVLDAACGLGYGSAILADGTLADRVVGVDADPSAIRYALDHYTPGRPRLSFDTRDVATLDRWPAASFDVVVSFETLEHLATPDTFLAACRRLLTPAGRLIASVPNEWIDETGTDPNPHHLHVFNRDRLESACRRHFAIERVFGQTAGGGMKLPDAPRRIWPADASSDAAEWWLIAGMVDPLEAPRVPFRGVDRASDDRTHVLAFARDYDNAWIVRAMVAIGQRTESPGLLHAMAARTLNQAPAASADAGAALCVRIYRAIEALETIDGTMLDRLNQYLQLPSRVPHVVRWQISLRYAAGLYHLAQGDVPAAAAAFEACAECDALAFSPLLATKTVGAALLRGWLAAQARDVDTARRWWTHGVAQAERALQAPWSDLVLSRTSPALFGLREAAVVVDLASQCAAGLHLLPHAIDRPGILAAQIFTSAADRAARAERQCRQLEADLDAARARLDDLETQAARAGLRATSLLRSSTTMPAAMRIAIFGAGSGGRTAVETLSSRGGLICCVTDNDARQHGREWAGVPVVPPAALPEHRPDLIAVASVPGRRAIFAQLEAMGYVRGRDFESI